MSSLLAPWSTSRGTPSPKNRFMRAPVERERVEVLGRPPLERRHRLAARASSPPSAARSTRFASSSSSTCSRSPTEPASATRRSVGVRHRVRRLDAPCRAAPSTSRLPVRPREAAGEHPLGARVARAPRAPSRRRTASPCPSSDRRRRRPAAAPGSASSFSATVTASADDIQSSCLTGEAFSNGATM